MDAYIPSLERQTFALSAFDMQGSFANIPYVFFYENVKRSQKFMEEQVLKRSLSKVLEEFPILAGHLRARGTGQIEVVVDPENLNVPEFLESSCDSVSYDDIMSNNFAWDSWPANLVTVGGYAAPAASNGEIKLLNVHVVRLRDNTGLVLFINIPHYAVDGAGYFAFTRKWASTAASLSQEHSITEASSSQMLVIDRTLIKKHLPTERRPVDGLSESMYSTANFLCDTLAWLAPTTLGKLLSRLGSLSRGEAHLFHLSKGTLDDLRVVTSEHMSEDIRLSDNDLLVALLSKTYVQSQPQPEPKAGWFTAAPKREELFSARIPCDARPRLGMRDANFTGNLLIPMFVRERLERLAEPTTPETLASAAVVVRKTIGSVDAPLIGAFHDIISRYPSSHMRPLAFAARQQTTSMVITSQVRFGLYDADFGDGGPGFVCLTSLFAGSYTMAAVLPTAPHQEAGVNVLLTSNAVAMGNILNNKFWMETATLIW